MDRRPSSILRRPERPRGFAGWRWELLGPVYGRTLEIGCGQGRNFEHYPGEAKVTAFDAEPERVRIAARRRTPVRLVVADAQHLAWPAQTFDSVVGTLVFCSIPQPAQALAEVRRVLRPGGRLYLIEHVRSHQAWLGRLQDWLAPAWLRATGGCNLNRNTLATVRAAGFHVERLKVVWGGLINVIVARSM